LRASAKGATGASQAQSEAAFDQLAQLAQVDRKVRAHEQAHLAVAGPYATSGPSFEYATGSDGKQYAIGGEVQIDASPVSGDPEATIRKAEVIQAAANAPADPSGQDRAVAAAAAQMEADARIEEQQNSALKRAYADPTATPAPTISIAA
jgi:hypothetical protein